MSRNKKQPKGKARYIKISNEERIVKLARHFNREGDMFLSSHLEKVIDSPNFDRDVEKATSKIIQSLSNFTLFDFKRELMDRACEKSFYINDADTGDVQLAQINIFAVPIIGFVDSIEDFAASSKLTDFARSFKACCLTDENSTIVVMPTMIDQVQLLDLTPGLARRLMSSYDKNGFQGVQETFRDVFRQADNSSPLNTLGQRAAIILHLHWSPYEDEDIETIENTAALVSAIGLNLLESERAETPMKAWSALVEKLTEKRFIFGSPMTLTEAVNFMAVNRITAGLQAEAQMLGLEVNDGYDELILNHCDYGLMEASAKLGVQLIGPVVVSMEALMYDMDQATDVFTALAKKITITNGEPNHPERLM